MRRKSISPSKSRRKRHKWRNHRKFIRIVAAIVVVTLFLCIFFLSFKSSSRSNDYAYTEPDIFEGDGVEMRGSFRSYSDKPQTTSKEAKEKVIRQLNRKRGGQTWRQPRANPDRTQYDTIVTIHTSHNAWTTTQQMLVSLASSRDKFDVLLIDDHSDQIDQNKLAESWGVKSLRWGKSTDGPMGATHSWNLAWRYAVENGYENLIICSNDLLVPDMTVQLLSTALESGSYDWVFPVVSYRGSRYPRRTLNDHWAYNSHSSPKRADSFAADNVADRKDLRSGLIKSDTVADWTDHPLHYHEVADVLYASSKNGPDVVPATRKDIHEYMMSFRVKRMKQYESQPGTLFVPRGVGKVGSVDELAKIMSTRGSMRRVGVVRNAFTHRFGGYAPENA